MQGVGHFDGVHEPPLLLLAPAGAAQEPPWHVCMFTVQSKHDCPEDPHAVSTAPDWQLLLVSQQPLHAAEAQDVGEPLLLDELLLPELPLPDAPLDELLLELPLPDPLLDELLVLLPDPPDDDDDDEAEPLLAVGPESSAGAESKVPLTCTSAPRAHAASTNDRHTVRSTKRIPLLGSGAPWPRRSPPRNYAILRRRAPGLPRFEGRRAGARRISADFCCFPATAPPS
jgi:hypothetical protein